MSRKRKAPESKASTKVQAPEFDDQHENDDYCCICDDGGVLVICDRCPQAFHKSCLELEDEDSLENGESWNCGDGGFKCTERRKVRHAVEDEKQEVEDEFVWLDEGRGSKNKRMHASCARGAVTLSLGSTVTLTNPAGDAGSSFVAEVMAMWENAHGEKQVQCRWFFRPEECKFASSGPGLKLAQTCEEGLSASDLSHEVYASSHCDDNPLNAVEAVCRVLSVPEYLAWRASPESSSSALDARAPEPEVLLKRGSVCMFALWWQVFFVRKSYNHWTGEFRPLLRYLITTHRGMDSTLRE
jgi:hypothetical protein